MTTFETQPNTFRHWRLLVDDNVATLELAVDSQSPAFGDYELKLNSYDIDVDIELANAIRHIRLVHTRVKCVVIKSALEGMFCAGANIRMLDAPGARIDY